MNKATNNVFLLGVSLMLGFSITNREVFSLQGLTLILQVVFSATSAGDLSGKIQIQNISTQIVGYKIKTTSPEKYRVRPSTGSLTPGLTATVEIHVSGGQATIPTSLARDKFLITAVFLESSELGQQQLAEALKTSRPDGQYRLRCQLGGSLAEQAGLGGGGSQASLGHGGHGGQGEHDSSRQVASILKKVSSLFRRCVIIKHGVQGEPGGHQAGGAGHPAEALPAHRTGPGRAGDSTARHSALLLKLRLHKVATHWVELIWVQVKCLQAGD